MKPGWIALATICALIFFGHTTFSQTLDKKSFETKLYSVQAISHFGVSDEKFAALTEVQKRSLIEARNDLIEMLQAIEHRRDVKRYVTPEMVRKYNTSDALAASVIEPETSILAAGVSDFSFVGTRTIRVHFFAVVFSEGNILVSEKVAVLKKTDSGWRFAGLE